VTINPPAPKPCESCPYRKDVPSGVWSEGEYRKLPRYDLPTAEQPHSSFQCHQTDQKSPRKRLCAGWVACHGSELLSLRLEVAMGQVDPSVLDYGTPTPVFGSGEEACAHGVKDIEHPGKKARALVRKISASRADVQFK
jgi:hypothetical protein